MATHFLWDQPKLLSLECCDLQFQPDLSHQTVETLLLGSNRIATLFDTILPQGIRVIDLGNNHIHNDGVPFIWPDTLEEIYLDFNMIQHTDGVMWPRSLRVLNLSKNPLSDFPTLLPNGLSKLICNTTRLRKIPALPPGLIYLSVNRSEIHSLPRSLPNGLLVLHASMNFLNYRGLPSNWGNSLRYVNLSNNHLKEFPDFPSTVEHIILNSNMISEIPCELPFNLKTLCVAKNKLKKIHIMNRRHPIRYVLLDNNQLLESYSDLQEDSGIHWAEHIQELDNWVEYDLFVERIRVAWRKFIFRKRLRIWKKTATIRSELLAAAMHPQRAGQFEDISHEWS
jgi:Leucine-rich repeat (LRR) protein